MKTQNRVWICLWFAAVVVEKHKTILFFAICVMITTVQIFVIFKNMQDLGRSISKTKGMGNKETPHLSRVG